MGYANNHGYSDGDTVSCSACGRALRVKLFKPGVVVVETTESMGNTAAICDDCGKTYCLGCTKRDLLPKCPSCGGDVTVPCA